MSSSLNQGPGPKEGTLEPEVQDESGLGDGKLGAADSAPGCLDMYDTGDYDRNINSAIEDRTRPTSPLLFALCQEKILTEKRLLINNKMQLFTDTFNDLECEFKYLGQLQAKCGQSSDASAQKNLEDDSLVQLVQLEADSFQAITDNFRQFTKKLRANLYNLERQEDKIMERIHRMNNKEDHQKTGHEVTEIQTDRDKRGPSPVASTAKRPLPVAISPRESKTKTSTPQPSTTLSLKSCEEQYLTEKGKLMKNQMKLFTVMLDELERDFKELGTYQSRCGHSPASMNLGDDAIMELVQLKVNSFETIKDNFNSFTKNLLTNLHQLEVQERQIMERIKFLNNKQHESKEEHQQTGHEVTEIPTEPKSMPETNVASSSNTSTHTAKKGQPAKQESIPVASSSNRPSETEKKRSAAKEEPIPVASSSTEPAESEKRPSTDKEQPISVASSSNRLTESEKKRSIAKEEPIPVARPAETEKRRSTDKEESIPSDKPAEPVGSSPETKKKEISGQLSPVYYVAKVQLLKPGEMEETPRGVVQLRLNPTGQKPDKSSIELRAFVKLSKSIDQNKNNSRMFEQVFHSVSPGDLLRLPLTPILRQIPVTER
ncbi:hypothetical protein Ciccas_007878 [Cichlidogyrus casuarinus]|uniref:Uncharacterized protein n=1 Tax=Cichlidogyrus casuarinus TaxID=1844966 RepID=A0ABD2Q1L4_9PLAT